MFKADFWQELAEKFAALQREEQTYLPRKPDDRLFIDGSFVLTCDQLTQTRWLLRGGPGDNFTARYEALAARAGAKLGPPLHTRPRDFWMQSMFFDLKERKSPLLRFFDRSGGFIENACEAATTLCVRLETKALEEELEPDPVSESSKEQRTPRRNASRIHDLTKGVIARIKQKTPKAPIKDICAILDKNTVPILVGWTGHGFTNWLGAWEHPNFKNRVKRYISEIQPKRNRRS